MPMRADETNKKCDCEPASHANDSESVLEIGLIDSSKNHADRYFDQYLDHNYLTRLLTDLINLKINIYLGF